MSEAKFPNQTEVLNILLAIVPPISIPWNIYEFCLRIAENLDQKLSFKKIEFPNLPSGLWFYDGDKNYIFYRADTSTKHRDHIILHEVCHMICCHHKKVQAYKNILVSDIVHTSSTVRKDEIFCNSYGEEIAEQFASHILYRVRKVTDHSVCDTELATWLGL